MRVEFSPEKALRKNSTTSPVALTRADLGSTLSNRGATAGVEYDLPLDAQPGDRFEAEVHAAFAVNVDPGAGGTIQLGAVAGTAGQKAVASTAGAHLTVTCQAAGVAGTGAAWFAKVNVAGAGGWAMV